MSYDYVDRDYDTFPGWHGTSCAGVAAASRNDDTCGVGVAYDVNLSGRSFYYILLIVL